MRRIVDIVGILVIILLIISVVIMPWPANIAIGGLLLITAILIFISDRRAKKKAQNVEAPDTHENESSI